ncbi:MAG: carbon starvation protein A [Calditrichaeota bacterium]|nr:MAG: carbon starvation protein A [Calditrichota bacterium]
MEIIVMVTVVFLGYHLMYRLYGGFLARKVFKLDAARITPAVAINDGVDFVPTRKEIIFGHHFTSIAGTGPIVGPAIAIIWGWLPALLWVFIGSAVMGAVHDFGSLVISLRNQGKSISEATALYINSRTRVLFFVMVFLALWIVIAIFGLVIAVIFNIYPSSVWPVWLQIPVAVWLGRMIYKRGRNITLWTLVALFVLYALVVLGYYLPFSMPEIAGIPPTGIWTILLLIYAYIASVLPVTTLLQPRDYINAYQLITTMALLVVGIIVSIFWGGMEVVAPAVQLTPADAPPLWPFLFITIACGAISGFHCLVCSGTTAKQLRSEPDARFVGYGSMLVEGALATLVIIAVAAGIGLGYTTSDGTFLTGAAAWNSHYASWMAAKGLGSKVGAFVDGSANMIAMLGIPKGIAVSLMGLFVASFAGTTLDTSTRIQRYVVSELGTDLNISALNNRYIATAVVVISAALLAFASGADGKGALALWPLFGAVNQTLGALALVIITIYLKRKGGWYWLTGGLPALFMSVMTLWAGIENQINFASSSLLLQSVNIFIIAVVGWILLESLWAFFHTKAVRTAAGN